jgi:RNA polymerase sigma-70 factor (ECF subfamily)
MSHKEIDRVELVDEHSDYLLSFAMSKIRDIDLAKDLVQDTLLSALSKLDSFEQRSTMRTWLTSILNRKIIDHWRKAETRYTDPISSFFDQEEKNRHWVEQKMGVSNIPNMEEKMTQEETVQMLRSCMDKLPEKWNGIVKSKYLEEKESEQICKDYEITSSNLWVIIHRSKLLLRDCLKQILAE